MPCEVVIVLEVNAGAVILLQFTITAGENPRYFIYCILAGFVNLILLYLEIDVQVL